MFTQENREAFTDPYMSFVSQHPYKTSVKDLHCFKSREDTDSQVQELSLEEKTCQRVPEIVKGTLVPG